MAVAWKTPISLLIVEMGNKSFSPLEQRKEEEEEFLGIVSQREWVEDFPVQQKYNVNHICNFVRSYFAAS